MVVLGQREGGLGLGVGAWSVGASICCKRFWQKGLGWAPGVGCSIAGSAVAAFLAEPFGGQSAAQFQCSLSEQ